MPALLPAAGAPGAPGAPHPLIEARASAAVVRAAIAARADALQSELDAIVSAQCLLCGDAIVAQIFEPIDLEAGDEEDWTI